MRAWAGDKQPFRVHIALILIEFLETFQLPSALCRSFYRLNPCICIFQRWRKQRKMEKLKMCTSDRRFKCLCVMVWGRGVGECVKCICFSVPAWRAHALTHTHFCFFCNAFQRVWPILIPIFLLLQTLVLLYLLKYFICESSSVYFSPVAVTAAISEVPSSASNHPCCEYLKMKRINTFECSRMPRLFTCESR